MIRSASPVWAFVELDDRLSFAGRRWRFDDVPVRPRPVPRPGAAQQRPPWRDELERLGRDPAAYRVGIIRPLLVTDEGDRARAAGLQE